MSPRIPRRLAVFFVLVLACAAGACSPSLSPLYRDYEVEAESRSVADRIEAALTEAGWKLKPAVVPSTVATEERKMSSWGLYSVFASLEVVPVGREYVRLYVHPYRKYFTGSRSKIPYLKRGLRDGILKDLNPAFEKQGLRALGTSIERDKETAAR